MHLFLHLLQTLFTLSVIVIERYLKKTKWKNIKPTFRFSGIFDGERIFEVEAWREIKKPWETPKLPMDFDDFKTELVGRIEGLDPLILDLFALQLVSSPPILEWVGGLNLAYYAGFIGGI